MIGLQLSPEPGRPVELLLLGAHSDDIEIGCGATVLALAAAHPDARVRWVVLSGEGERVEEARASAEAFLDGVVDVTVEVLSFRESHFPWVAVDVKAQFERLKAECTPDVVFTHHRHDRHQDHRTVAELTWNTFRSHLVLEYEIPKYEGDLAHPGLFVPVAASTAARKAALVTKHFASQQDRQWFDEETFLGLMRIRGVECASPSGYAEAFHVPKLSLTV